MNRGPEKANGIGSDANKNQAYRVITLPKVNKSKKQKNRQKVYQGLFEILCGP
jgi:hypothetical protein